MKSRLMAAALVFVLGLFVFNVSAFARSDVGFKGIGARLGYVDPSDSYGGTIGFGLLTDLGTFAPKVHWDAAAYFWSASRGYDYPPYSWDWTLRDFALKSDVTYHFIEGDWEPYAGGGLGIHFFSWDYKYPHGYGGPHFSASSTNIGLQLVGGVEHKFNSRWKGNAELELDFTDTDQIHLQIGAVYMLGK